MHKGRPWSLPLEDRVLLVAAYWRTNPTMRQLAPLFGISKSAADRIVDHLGPHLALQLRRRFAMETVLIVDGTLVPTRDHAITEQSKNYRYSTAHQVVVDADAHLVVVVGRPLPDNRHDSRGWAESGAQAGARERRRQGRGGAAPAGVANDGLHRYERQDHSDRCSHRPRAARAARSLNVRPIADEDPANDRLA